MSTRFSEKGERLLAIAEEIVELERRLTEKRREFFRVAERPFVPGVRIERTTLSIRQRAAEIFAERPGEEIAAGAVVARLRGVATEVVHATLSKMAAAGEVERVRFGVYRLPRKPENPEGSGESTGS